jgi:hypothetical protein
MRISDAKPGTVVGRLTILKEPYYDPSVKVSVVQVLCECGTEKILKVHHLGVGRTSGCGCQRSQPGNVNPSWRGGRWVDTREGYVHVYAPEHPNSDKRGYVCEHIKVMTERLGRPLVKGETVHHKHGVRDDNRLEKLELWSTAQPAGQRVEDKVTWAIELLRLYAPESLREEYL